jgi:hypothetical protein
MKEKTIENKKNEKKPFQVIDSSGRSINNNTHHLQNRSNFQRKKERKK